MSFMLAKILSRAKKKPPKQPRVPQEIGWAELVDLPDLGIIGLHAKIDSGARTSSLHATRIRTFERDGEPWVRFHFQPGPRQHRDLEAPLVAQRKVISSNGKAQNRHVIKTQLKMGKVTRKLEITLSNRGTMAFPMLIGRNALRKRFLVDVARKYVLASDRESQ